VVCRIFLLRITFLNEQLLLDSSGDELESLRCMEKLLVEPNEAWGSKQMGVEVEPGLNSSEFKEGCVTMLNCVGFGVGKDCRWLGSGRWSDCRGLGSGRWLDCTGLGSGQ